MENVKIKNQQQFIFFNKEIELNQQNSDLEETINVIIYLIYYKLESKITKHRLNY